jgi:hypothetical protein
VQEQKLQVFKAECECDVGALLKIIRRSGGAGKMPRTLWS